MHRLIRAVRVRRIAAIAVVSITALGAASAPCQARTAEAPGAEERVVLDDGHVDIGPRFADGSWTIQLRDDTLRTSQWRALDDIVLHATDAARSMVPDAPEYAFLGAPGEPVWLLPQVQERGVLWPGWNTQDAEVVERIGREVDWTLHGVDGPGRFVLFESEGFGQPRALFTTDEPLPQEISIAADTHVHGNWAFSAPGTYLLDIEMSAGTSDGTALADRRRLRFFVGSGDPGQAFLVASPSETGEGGGSGLVIASGVAAALTLLAGTGLWLGRRRTDRTVA